VARSTEIIREWLAKKGINAPELVFENGAGLSRAERSSAATLAGLLTSAWGSSVMPEFIASMPLLGVDGTLRKRARSDAVAGQAHVKTGTLNDAAAIAGYVQDMNGRRWLVVMMINHANAPQTQAAQDALLAWVHAGANLTAPGAIVPAAAPLPAAAFKPQ
jgi:serine-type D-Ala-D-Ala carboxypeptidase/endopeptidase (penicillin-binding protein 4)